MKPRIILLGYGEMGTAALEGLSNGFEILTVVTPPEISRFRTPAVKRTEGSAEERKIPIYRDNGLDGLHDLVQRKNPEAVVICSYDKVIPQQTLSLCPFINVHHGDLPRFRGRANINWAIINGRERVGISIHQAVPELDAGGIYHQWDLPILPSDYVGDIYRKLNDHVRNDLPGVVDGILSQKMAPRPQEGEATYCCTRLPEDGRINWNSPAERIRNLIRGVSRPFTGAFTDLDDWNRKGRLIIWKADLPTSPRIYEGNIPGRVARILHGRGVEVLTATVPLIITEVQFEGLERRADELICSIAATLK